MGSSREGNRKGTEHGESFWSVFLDNLLCPAEILCGPRHMLLEIVIITIS